MRRFALVAAVAGLVMVPLLAVPTSAAPERDGAAETALARAEALLAPPPAAARSRSTARPHPTPVLTELLRLRDELSPTDRRRADALLARPTSPGGDGLADYRPEEATPHCGPDVCIHYVRRTSDAPPLADGDADGVPDSVERALAEAQSVHDTYVSSGYRSPDPDGAKGTGEDLVDIYLANLGDQGFYGYCTSDRGSGVQGGWNLAAYCAIDNDFAEFAGDPLANQRVTLAHEYFHAIQYAYDASEDLWFTEATATWAEDELFDDVDDNLQYLDQSQLALPGSPLDRWQDRANYQYGNWVFFRHLSERWPEVNGSLPEIVLEMLQLVSGREGDPDLYSTQAIQRVLAQRGTSFTEVYGDFVEANRRPSASYEEGAAYPVARPQRTWTLGAGSRRLAPFTTRLAHLSSTTLRYRPGDGTAQRRWRLRLDVDLPALVSGAAARVVVHRTDGTVAASPVALSRDGIGRATLDFSSRRVSRVELLLVNASRRTRCWRGTDYACAGQPRDDGAPQVVSARSFRR